MRFLWCCLALLLVLQTVAWFPVTSRLLPLNHHTNLLPGTRVISTETSEASYSSKQKSKEGRYRGMNQLGSRPPKCDQKCDGCNPCIAIQVPTMTSHLRIQFANYEPEIWKCKCGLSVYTP